MLILVLRLMLLHIKLDITRMQMHAKHGGRRCKIDFAVHRTALVPKIHASTRIKYCLFCKVSHSFLDVSTPNIFAHVA